MASHFFSSQFFALCGAPQLLFSLYAPFGSLLSLFFSIFQPLWGTTASFFSLCPVRFSSFPFLLNFSLSAGYHSFFSFSMPRPKLFFPFSSRFFNPCGASQLLFLLHTPFEALLSLFFSIFRSLRGTTAFFLSMPRPMHWFSDYKAAMPAGSGHIRSAS